MGNPTSLIHHTYRPPEGFDSPQPGVFKASTVIFSSAATMRERTWKSKSGYTYGLHGTPSTFLLEERLCELDGGQYCVLAPSGLAAIALVNMALLKPGDEVLLPDTAYGPNLHFARHDLQGWGISHQLYDPSSTADLAAKLNDKTRLVWVEAAGSITLEFPDLLGITRLCRSRGITTALDHTWGAGVAYSPLGFDAGQGGADIAVHALTKYPSGGGDVLMGSVVVRSDALHERIKLSHMRLGLGVGGNDVEAILRGLPSLHLRYRQQNAAARELAKWCLESDEFAAVLHPAFNEGSGQAHWQAACPSGLAAGLLTLALPERFDQTLTDQLCDQLRLFKLGYSWAGPMSLAVPYEAHQLPSRSRLPPSQYLLRLSAGLEDAPDLVADLKQALMACK
jgi:cysteine-S-conjugate beta-lyase